MDKFVVKRFIGTKQINDDEVANYEIISSFADKIIHAVNERILSGERNNKCKKE